MLCRVLCFQQADVVVQARDLRPQPAVVAVEVLRLLIERAGLALQRCLLLGQGIRRTFRPVLLVIKLRDLLLGSHAFLPQGLARLGKLRLGGSQALFQRLAVLGHLRQRPL